MTTAAIPSRDNAIARNANPSPDFPAKLEATVELLRQAARDHGRANGGAGAPAITQASSLGAEDMVISHLIESKGLPIDVFVLDTGMLHAQTIALLERLKATSRAPVEVFTPVNEAVVEFVAREGKDAMYKSVELRKACCGIRKTEPLARALAGYDAWITGMRREQSSDRAEVPLKDTSQATAGGRIKYNPLADWTWGDVWHYIAVKDVDYNPLHDQFFPSIGCAPCTRAITLGEDFRAGRWWWENDQQKECGLHVAAASPIKEGTPA